MELLLYHGSNSYFNGIDLSKMKPHRDFGRGFYLADEKADVIPLIFKNSNFGYIYTYSIDLDILYYGLDTKFFEGFTSEWMDFVIACRASNGTPHPYDVVIGNIADAHAKELFAAFNQDTDKDKLLKEVSRHNHGTQYMFATEKAIQHLRLLEVEEME